MPHYKQVTADEAMRLCRAGTVVLAARYIDSMPFREASEAALLLAEAGEEPVRADEAAGPPRNAIAPPKAKAKGTVGKGRKRLDIDIREVARMKAAGKTTGEMADAAGVTPKQMAAWMYTNKTKVEEALRQLKGAVEVAAACCRKEDRDEE